MKKKTKIVLYCVLYASKHCTRIGGNLIHISTGAFRQSLSHKEKSKIDHIRRAFHFILLIYLFIFFFVTFVIFPRLQILTNHLVSP